MIEYILLGILTYGDMTGYDLKKFMAGSTANFYEASFGSIYPALKRMEQKGWVQVQEATVGGKVKKFYGLQELGRSTCTHPFCSIRFSAG